jgi:hypothetical protein
MRIAENDLDAATGFWTKPEGAEKVCALGEQHNEDKVQFKVSQSDRWEVSALQSIGDG